MNRTAGETVFFSEAVIATRVEALACAIAAGRPRPEISAPVLVGAFVFAADLLRALARLGLDLPTEFLWLASYGVRETSGAVRVLHGPGEAVRGRIVLLIDTVLETGVTLARAKTLLLEAGATGIVSVAAVVKPHPNPAFVADHVGFTAGPEFLYGYGLDRNGAGRSLPDLCILGAKS